MTNEEMFYANVNIAYKIASRYLINYKNEYEDIKQIALLGLWKAVLTYNKSYAFSTYAYKVISNEINYSLRKNKKRCEIPLQETIHENIKLEDVIASTNNDIEQLEERIDNKEHLRKIRNVSLSKRDKLVMDLHLRSYTQCEIAKIIGVSQPTVGRVLRRTRKNLKR